MRDVGARHGESTVLIEYANTLRLAGEIEEATELHQQALRLAERGDYLLQSADAHAGLGHCLVDREPAGARQHWQAALALYRQLDVPQPTDVELGLRRCAEQHPGCATDSAASANRRDGCPGVVVTISDSW
jgi:hypothetical protein